MASKNSGNLASVIVNNVLERPTLKPLLFQTTRLNLSKLCSWDHGINQAMETIKDAFMVKSKCSKTLWIKGKHVPGVLKKTKQQASKFSARKLYLKREDSGPAQIANQGLQILVAVATLGRGRKGSCASLNMRRVWMCRSCFCFFSNATGCKEREHRLSRGKQLSGFCGTISVMSEPQRKIRGVAHGAKDSFLSS